MRLTFDLFLIGFGLVVAWKCWMWLLRRHPLWAFFIVSFVRGLLGGRRR